MLPPRGIGSARARGRTLLLGLLGLLVVVAGANLTRLPNGFVIDDDELIVEGELIHDPLNLPVVFGARAFAARQHASSEVQSIDTYRPLTMATFFWDAAVSGRRPWSYHLTNLVLHLLVVVGVWRVARRLLPPDREPWALFAAGWVGLAPVVAEAHVWINGRSDAVAAVFLLISLFLWFDERGGVARSLGAGLAFLAALFAKEAVLPAVVVLVLYDLITGRRRGLLLRAAPLVAAAAAYLVARTAILSGMAAGDSEQLTAGILRLPLFWLEGLRQVIAPSDVSMRIFADEVAAMPVALVVAAWVVVAGIGVGAWWVRRRAPLLTLGLGWFAAMSAPAAVVVWPGFGRYFYVPLLLLAVAVADLLARLDLRVRPKRWVPWLSAGYLLTCAIALQPMIQSYRSEESFYGEILEQHPESALGYGGLGSARAKQKRYDEAIALLEEAQRIRPRESYAENLALTYVLAGRPQDGYELAIASLALEPERPAELYNIAALAVMNRSVERTAELVLEGLLVAPDHPALRGNVAALTTRHSQREAYVAVFTRLLAQPRYSGLASTLGF